jgi:hypothetical protein
MDAEVLPRPVDTTGDEDDDSIHAFCPRRQVTLCGQDASQHPEVAIPESIDQICRICLLAFEMYEPNSQCPVCGGLTCLG